MKRGNGASARWADILESQFCDYKFKVPLIQNINTLKPGDACTSMNWVVIGPRNELSPVRWQAITWTNDDLFSVDS